MRGIQFIPPTAPTASTTRSCGLTVLVFTRKVDDAIIIGDGIEIKILRVGRDSVRIGVTAPLAGARASARGLRFDSGRQRRGRHRLGQPDRPGRAAQTAWTNASEAGVMTRNCARLAWDRRGRSRAHSSPPKRMRGRPNSTGTSPLRGTRSSRRALPARSQASCFAIGPARSPGGAAVSRTKGRCTSR